MDARTQKLKIAGLDLEDASALVQAGIDTPAKIRKATDADLEKAGASKTRVRKKFKKEK